MPKTRRVRQEEAAERKTAHDKLSTAQKLAKCAGRRGASKREVKRLSGEK